MISLKRLAQNHASARLLVVDKEGRQCMLGKGQFEKFVRVAVLELLEQMQARSVHSLSAAIEFLRADDAAERLGGS